MGPPRMRLPNDGLAFEAVGRSTAARVAAAMPRNPAKAGQCSGEKQVDGVEAA
jgi:hypothetical protein